MSTHSKPWYLYVVCTADETLYAGISTDVKRRFREHQAQGLLTAKYLKSHKPQALVFSQMIGSRSLALKVEYHFKRLERWQKQGVVQSGVLSFDAETGRVLF
ncbi:GIY-YIG nuclease superfamily protein [Chitinispirillum alkaliphilum]|nr:GIY-YIG nuclease superfamily protein [Chitinispirillum alkaliphilum]